MSTKATADIDLLTLASEYVRVRDVAAMAVKYREELKAELKSRMIDRDANVALLDEVIVGEERLVPTPCESTVVDAEALQERLTKAMWSRITLQVLDMAKYRAACEEGRIKPQVIEAVEATSTVWQLRTFTNLPKNPVKK